MSKYTWSAITKQRLINNAFHLLFAALDAALDTCGSGRTKARKITERQRSEPYLKKEAATSIVAVIVGNDLAIKSSEYVTPKRTNHVSTCAGDVGVPRRFLKVRVTCKPLEMAVYTYYC